MNHYSKTATVNSYIKGLKSRKYNLNHQVQRGSEQWNKTQKSLLIDSVIRNYIPIPALSALKIDDKTFSVIDGKQRLSTLYSFYNNEFKLSKEIAPIIINNEEIELANKKFKDLPTEIQDNFLSFEIPMIIYEDYSLEQISEVFSRLNNGTVLSKEQKMKAQLITNEKLAAFINRVSNSDFFTQKINLTTGQLRKNEDISVILQTLMLITNTEYVDFTAKSVLNFANTVDLNDDIFNKMDKGIELLNSIFEEKQKVLKKINLPVVIAVASLCDTKAKEDKFKKFIKDFVENYENNTEYKAFLMSSTTKKENVQGKFNYFLNGLK